MLTDQEKVEIDKEILKFAVRQSACLEALLVVQKYRGYVSDEALADVALYLGMSATQLDGIATFYNLIFRKPVGKCVIRLCDSVSCWIMGYEAIKDQIQKKLGIDWGETTPDQQFTLLSAQCLGTCDKAPALMINEHLYQNVTSEELDSIVQLYKKKQKTCAEALSEERGEL